MTAGQSGRLLERREVLKGSAEQVIRVRVPVPGIFREAVFFLHEDYLRRGDLSREELLRQARRAAEDYARPFLPEKRRTYWWLWPLLLLAGLVIGICIGMLL